MEGVTLKILKVGQAPSSRVLVQKNGNTSLSRGGHVSVVDTSKTPSFVVDNSSKGIATNNRQMAGLNLTGNDQLFALANKYQALVVNEKGSEQGLKPREVIVDKGTNTHVQQNVGTNIQCNVYDLEDNLTIKAQTESATMVWLVTTNEMEQTVKYSMTEPDSSLDTSLLSQKTTTNELMFGSHRRYSKFYSQT